VGNLDAEENEPRERVMRPNGKKKTARALNNAKPEKNGFGQKKADRPIGKNTIEDKKEQKTDGGRSSRLPKKLSSRSRLLNSNRDSTNQKLGDTEREGGKTPR